MKEMQSSWCGGVKVATLCVVLRAAVSREQSRWGQRRPAPLPSHDRCPTPSSVQPSGGHHSQRPSWAELNVGECGCEVVRAQLLFTRLSTPSGSTRLGPLWWPAASAGRPGPMGRCSTNPRPWTCISRAEEALSSTVPPLPAAVRWRVVHARVIGRGVRSGGPPAGQRGAASRSQVTLTRLTTTIPLCTVGAALLAADHTTQTTRPQTTQPATPRTHNPSTTISARQHRSITPLTASPPIPTLRSLRPSLTPSC